MHYLIFDASDSTYAYRNTKYSMFTGWASTPQELFRSFHPYTETHPHESIEEWLASMPDCKLLLSSDTLLTYEYILQKHPELLI